MWQLASALLAGSSVTQSGRSTILRQGRFHQLVPQNVVTSASPISSRWLHRSSQLQSAPCPWSQEDLDRMRSLLAEGKKIADVATALRKSKYAVQQVARYDPGKKGWYTPERPIDVPRFRKDSNSRSTNREVVRSQSGAYALKRRPWEQSEYERAIELQLSGMAPSKIAEELGRPLASVRSALYRKSTKFRDENFSPNEDEKIHNSIAKGKGFEDLEELMPHRSRDALMKRTMDLGIGKPTGRTRWREEELLKLRQLAKQSLTWAQVSAQIPGRSPGACQNKFLDLSTVVRPDRSAIAGQSSR